MTGSATMEAAESGAAPQPLRGLRGVEFTHMVMGPTCGMVLAVLGAVPLDRHAAVPLVAAEDGHRRQACRLHAWRRAQPIEQLVVEVDRGLVLVAVEGRRQLEGHEIVEHDARVGRFQILEAPHEQASAEQQQEAEGDLRRHEPLAQEK